MNTNIDYNNGPMMDLNEYNKSEGMDLNMINNEILDKFSKTLQNIWVTEIHLDENNEIVDNYICSYIVVKVDDKFYLRDITGENIYEFKNVMGFFALPDNVHASTSYGYINRYRYEEYKKLVVQKEEKKTTNKFEFTLKQAKEALAEKFGFSVENICIKL